MSKSYGARAITLKATKLGEADLILSLLSNEGILLKGVLKSARNPKSKTVGHSALYQTNNLLLHKGRNLDIITEVQSLKARRQLMSNYEQGLAASFACEVSYVSVSSGNEEKQLYVMLESLLDTLEGSSVESAPALGLAFALKTLALLGVRPQTEVCELCDNTDSSLSWSSFHRGAVCEDCFSLVRDPYAPHTHERTYSAATIAWIELLLKNPFVTIAATVLDPRALLDVADIVKVLLEDFFSHNFKTFKFFISTIQVDS